MASAQSPDARREVPSSQPSQTESNSNATGMSFLPSNQSALETRAMSSSSWYSYLQKDDTNVKLNQSVEGNGWDSSSRTPSGEGSRGNSIDQILQAAGLDPLGQSSIGSLLSLKQARDNSIGDAGGPSVNSVDLLKKYGFLEDSTRDTTDAHGEKNRGKGGIEKSKKTGNPIYDTALKELKEMGMASVPTTTSSSFKPSRTPSATDAKDNQKQAAFAVVKRPPASSQKGRNKSNAPKEFVDIKDEDVLCGRGGKSNHHPGNKRYRQVIKEWKEKYRVISAKTEKTGVSRKIVSEVYSYGGRFLKKDYVSGLYYVMPENEARRKTSQALRETKELKWLD